MPHPVLTAHAVLVAHAAPAVHAAQVAHVLALKLPEPKPGYTVPIIIIFVVLATIALLRKVIALALLALVIAIAFLAYQSGAFNHWVDKGKQVIGQQR